MNIRKFDSLIALKEGKKKQVSMGNIREVRARIFEMLRAMPLFEMLKLIGWK